jgi:hypothetical protein
MNQTSKKNQVSIKNWLTYWTKSPWLVIGSILLVGTWLWEKSFIANHRAHMDELKRYNSNFYNHVMEFRMETARLSVWDAAFDANKTPNNLKGLMAAYSNATITAQEAIFWSYIMNGEGIDDATMANIEGLMADSLRAMSERKDTANLRRIYNETVLQFDTSHLRLQREYNFNMNRTEKSFSREEKVYLWAYALGVLLLAIHKGRSDILKEKEESLWHDKIDSIFNRRKI